VQERNRLKELDQQKEPGQEEEERQSEAPMLSSTPAKTGRIASIPQESPVAGPSNSG